VTDQQHDEAPPPMHSSAPVTMPLSCGCLAQFGPCGWLALVGNDCDRHWPGAPTFDGLTSDEMAKINADLTDLLGEALRQHTYLVDLDHGPITLKRQDPITARRRSWRRFAVVWGLVTLASWLPAIIGAVR
jgi:hypothetical protein